MNAADDTREFNSEHFGQNLVQIGPEMAEKIGVQKTSKIGNCGPMVFASLDKYILLNIKLLANKLPSCSDDKKLGKLDYNLSQLLGHLISLMEKRWSLTSRICLYAG